MRSSLISFALMMTMFAGTSAPASESYAPNLVGALEIESQLEELSTLASKTSLSNPEQLRAVRLESRVNQVLMRAFFTLNATIARLNSEIAQASQLKQSLENKRTHKVQLMQAATFLTVGSIGATGNAISIPPKEPPTKGNILGAIANGTSVLLGSASIATQLSGQSVTVSGLKPNMLACLLAPDALDANEIPKLLRGYLNVVHPNASSSPAATLIEKWRRQRLLSNGSGDIALLCGLRGDTQRVDIRLLSRQITMLEDLRTTIFQMNHELNEVASSVPSTAI